MMSLFSSFDLYFFSFSIFLLIMILLNLYSHIFKNNLMNLMMNFIFLMLGKFFLSLKLKSFNKNLLNLFLTIFVYLFFINFCSVLSFNFAFSSQVSFILILGFGMWFSYILFLNKNCWKGFFSHCIPEGTPMYLVWFLFIIELISNMIRPITITIRLVANILAGHLLLILLSNLVMIFYLSSSFYLLLNLVEFAVALIQSYIFSTMLVLYYSDVN